MVPFEPSEEHWNEYTFSDGTIVRFRIVVTRIVKRPNTPVGQYDIMTNNLSMVFAPPTDRGQPTGPIPPADAQSADKYEVRPITTEEHWNVYRLVTSDDVIKVKYVASNFFKLKNKFDQFGEPMYLVLGGPLIVPQPKFGKKGQTGA